MRWFIVRSGIQPCRLVEEGEAFIWVVPSKLPPRAPSSKSTRCILELISVKKTKMENGSWRVKRRLRRAKSTSKALTATRNESSWICNGVQPWPPKLWLFDRQMTAEQGANPEAGGVYRVAYTIRMTTEVRSNLHLLSRMRDTIRNGCGQKKNPAMG